MQAPSALQLSTKDRVMLNLIKIELSSEYGDIIDSLNSVKQLLGDSASGQEA